MTEVRPIRELAPHLVWEVVLLLVAGGVAAGLYNANSNVFSRGAVWAGIAVLGFAACGLALSLRTATPNLAIGPIAAATGWVFAKQVNNDVPTAGAIAVAVLAAAGIGLVLALFVGLTALPGWAVTLGGGFIVSAVLLETGGARTVPVTGARMSTGFGLWAAGFVVVSIAGAVLFALPSVRRALSAARPAAGGDDPAAWRPGKLLGALVGITGSSALAGLAGVLSVRLLGAASPVDNGLLPLALAAVLLGGVSVLGRRAGIFGVVLGVVIVDFARRWAQLEGASAATGLLIVGLLALVGLLAVWLLELVGRRVAPLTAVSAGPLPPGATGASPFGGQPFGPPGSQPGLAPAGFPLPGSPQPGFPPPGVPAQPGFGGPAQASPAGYPSPTSGGPVFGQPIHPSGPTSGAPPQPAGQPPVSGGPAYPGGPPAGPSPWGAVPPLPGQGTPATIPRPWTVPGAPGTAPQVPSQSASPPVSGPPSSDPPGHPQSPPPSWPPQR